MEAIDSLVLPILVLEKCIGRELLQNTVNRNQSLYIQSSIEKKKRLLIGIDKYSIIGFRPNFDKEDFIKKNGSSKNIKGRDD